MRAKLKHALPYAKKRLSLAACWESSAQTATEALVAENNASAILFILTKLEAFSTHYYPKISSAQLKPVDPAPQSTGRNNIPFFLTKRCSESRSAISPPRHQSLRLALTGS
ncbi:predicted protein [Histoplasma capsulatum H143]|uniref:Uncharacterized protein n=1 Tax=Ajellomyces capsulatus (strain H143) TaxID=544712 RepID=C6HE98_AJECH|nr:predicted protein [Histoplasma capsulatum H143]